MEGVLQEVARAGVANFENLAITEAGDWTVQFKASLDPSQQGNASSVGGEAEAASTEARESSAAAEALLEALEGWARDAAQLGSSRGKAPTLWRHSQARGAWGIVRHLVQDHSRHMALVQEALQGDHDRAGTADADVVKGAEVRRPAAAVWCGHLLLMSIVGAAGGVECACVSQRAGRRSRGWGGRPRRRLVGR